MQSLKTQEFTAPVQSQKHFALIAVQQQIFNIYKVNRTLPLQQCIINSCSMFFRAPEL